VFVGIVANGRCFPPFIATHDRRLPEIDTDDDYKLYKMETGSGRGTNAMLAWLDWCWRTFYLNTGDLVLLDRSRTHTSA
jgi:hypothetical protein